MITVQEQHTLKALENFCSKANKRLSEIDWEQRRYEIAKEIYVGCFLMEDEMCRGDNWRDKKGTAQLSIEAADILIEELKKR